MDHSTRHITLQSIPFSVMAAPLNAPIKQALAPTETSFSGYNYDNPQPFHTSNGHFPSSIFFWQQAH
ncbi:MAG: hypothetical protein KKD65_14195, partial [Gammaproteobacteria bacterium]|nr:hypothetical protein [Gammaproteobacteria bacterium]